MKSARELIDEIQGTIVQSGHLAFWWLGQHSFIVRSVDCVLYFDPYLSPGAARLVPPLLAPGDVTNADIVLGSHLHGDHIDPPTFAAIAAASPAARFIVPNIAVPPLAQAGIAPHRVTGLDAGGALTVGSTRITAVKAAHEFFDRSPDTGYPYLGFVVETGGATVYHSGDTLKYEGLETSLNRWSIDLAFLPINGRDAERLRRNCIGNMTYQEAADLAGALRPRLTIPGHYGMFAGNTIDPALFVDYLAAKYPDLPLALPTSGARTLL